MLLPPELSRFANLPHLKSRGTEFSAGCPVCGTYGHVGNDEPDRFRMWPGANARGWCRRCGHFEWADTEQHKWTQEQVVLAIRAREELAQREQDRLQSKIQSLQQQAVHQFLHDNMTKEQRQYWEHEGIPSSVQDYFTLGFMPNKTYIDSEKERQVCPALSIPYFNTGGDVVNIQYRLLTETEADRYRFTYGLPTALYLTDTNKPLGGTALVVEGGKKAIVSYLHMGDRVDHVIGLPSKTPALPLLRELSAFDAVYIMLDPDAYRPEKDGSIRAHKIAKEVGKDKTKLVQLPMKIDDMLNGGLVTPRQLWATAQQGRRLT